MLESTEEPLNKGHFGNMGLVLYSEVVSWREAFRNLVHSK